MQMSQRREHRESWSCAWLWLVALVSCSSQTGSSQAALRSYRRKNLLTWLTSNRRFLCRAGWGTPGKASGSTGRCRVCSPCPGRSQLFAILRRGHHLYPPSPLLATRAEGPGAAFGAGLWMEPSSSPIACLMLFQAIHSHLPVAAPSSNVIWALDPQGNSKPWQIPHASGFQI